MATEVETTPAGITQRWPTLLMIKLGRDDRAELERLLLSI